jgi:hypothetical protein
VIIEVEPGRDKQTFAFPIARKRLDAVCQALGEDWRRGFAQPFAIKELVACWTPPFKAAAHDHTTVLDEAGFAALCEELLDRITSPRLRGMFRREIAIARPVRDGKVSVPTGTLLASRRFLRHTLLHSIPPGLAEGVIEAYLAELAGDPPEEPGFSGGGSAVLDHTWLVDGRPASADDVRALPARDVARVSFLLNGEPEDPSKWFPLWGVPYAEIDHAFHLAVGPYVPSLGTSDVVMMRGRRINEPSWNSSAFMAALKLDLKWRVFTEAADVRQLALDPSFDASRDGLAEIAARGDAVVCCVGYAE